MSYRPDGNYKYFKKKQIRRTRRSVDWFVEIASTSGARRIYEFSSPMAAENFLRLAKKKKNFWYGHVWDN